MYALQKLALEPGLVFTDAADIPSAAEGELLLTVNHAGICGSDIHAYLLDADYTFMAPHLPITMGHEISGVICESADPAFPVGQRVTAIPSIGCGRCLSCLTGEERDCDYGTFLGFTRAGGFAKHIAVPKRNLIPIPDNVDSALGALCEPLTIAAEAVLTGGVGLGDTVLVLGAGTIGQAAALFAREAGAADVIIIGLKDAKRFETLRAMGFEKFIDVSEISLGDGLARLGIHRVDCAIEASGSHHSFSNAIPFIRKGGVLVIAGIYSSIASIDLTRMVRSRIQIRSTYRSETATWFRVLSLLSANPGKYRPLITHELSIVDFAAGFELAISKESSKILLTPE